MSKSQEQKQNLYKKLRVASIVKETLETKGWVEILGPLLEKRINSVCGYKNNNNIFVDGYVDSPKESLEYYRGYKVALMDMWNDAYNHIPAMERLNKQIDMLLKDEKGEDIEPMKDTRYA